MVPAAESPTARGTVDSAGAAETEGKNCQGKEPTLKSSCPVHLPFSLYTDDNVQSGRGMCSSVLY